MPLQDNASTLVIEYHAELAELQAIPRTVNKIMIKNLTLASAHLAGLPAHVKTLVLDQVTIQGTLVLAEGLETLDLQVDLVITVPMKNWIFPASLKLLIADAYSWDNADFQSVTAPAIVLQEITGSHEGPILPENLDELTINGYFADSLMNKVTFAETDDSGATLIKLPPYLRRMNLINVAVRSEATPETRAIKELYAEQSNADDLIRVFSGLETVHFKKMGSYHSPSLGFRGLKELILEESGSIIPAAINALELESLIIINAPRGSGPPFIVSEEPTTLGPSLVTMNLTRVNRFPVAEEWERLSSVTITGSKIELPYIRWLDELIIDQPLLTNGVMVSDLDEYKQAWGFRSKAKRPQNARDLA